LNPLIFNKLELIIKTQNRIDTAKLVDLGISLNSYIKKIQEREKTRVRFCTFEHGSSQRDEINSPEFLIEPIIPKKGFVIISGETGNYKTFTSINLGLCLSSGKDFLGFKVKDKSNVLYIDEENNCSIIKDRQDAIEKGLNIEVDNFFPMSEQSFNFSNEDDFKSLEYLIESKKINVVIVDSLPATTEFSENQNTGMNLLYRTKIKSLMKKYNLTWVLIHHFKKGTMNSFKPEILLDQLRGNSLLKYFLDNAICIAKKNDGEFYFIPCKTRSSSLPKPKLIKIKIQNNLSKEDKLLDSVTFEDCGESDITCDVYTRCSKVILQVCKENNITKFSTSKKNENNILDVVESRYKFSQNTCYKAIRILLKEKKIERPDNNSNGEYLII